MSDWGIVTTGRRDFPRYLWTPADFEAERREWERLEGPLTHAPGGPPPELKFSLFERPVRGARSKAVDELVAKHVGRPGVGAA